MPNFQNRTLLIGENLGFLRQMDRETIDLAIFDPPFEMHRRSQIAPQDPLVPPDGTDRMHIKADDLSEEAENLQDIFPQTVHILESAHHTYDSQMKAFMAFTAIRLIEIRELMKDTAILHFQCGLANNHHCRVLLDGIFGKVNFLGQILWTKPGTGSLFHHVILVYAKTETGALNHKPTLDRPSLLLWNDIKPEGMKRTPHGDFIAPLDLYKRLIALSSNPEDMVLDAFAGTGSALVAAEQTNRQWIGIEYKEDTVREILKRLGPETGLKRNQYFTLREIPEPETPYVQPIPRFPIPNRVFKSVLLRRHGKICQGCGQPFHNAIDLSVDHILATANNGSNTLDNMTLLCQPCNRAKGHTQTLEGLIQQNHQKGLLRFSTAESLLLLHRWHKT